MLERRWGPLGALKTQVLMGRSGPASHTRILDRATQGKKGLSPQPQGGCGWFGNLCGAWEPPAAQAPKPAPQMLASEARKGITLSPFGCFHSLQREDEGAPPGVPVLLLLPGRSPE